MTRVFAVVPRDEIFEKTGIQFQKFNTLYQLYSEVREVEGASMLLLLPDLINYKLTGKAFNEYTNATTTQMINAATREWDTDLLDRLDLPRRLLSYIVPAGTRLGKLRPEIVDKTGLRCRGNRTCNARYGQCRCGRTADRRKCVYLLRHVVADRGRTRPPIDDSGGRAAKFHERRRCLRYVPISKERDGPLDL